MVLCVCDAHVVETLGAKLLEALVELDSDLIKLLIGSVAQAEDGVAHAFKRLWIRLVFQRCFKPLVESLGVVAWVAFVVSCNADYHQLMAAELFRAKIVEVNNFGTFDAKKLRILVQLLSKLLSCACLASEVNCDLWEVSGHSNLVKRCHS